jgi:putative endonuclease
MIDWWRRFFEAPDAGRNGEKLAANWLRRERKFQVIARNWRSPRDRRDEIDLVARDGEVLVFVEVKARAANALVSGLHAVDERKRAALRRAIEAYLAGLRTKPLTVRFDVVEVLLPVSGSGGASRAEVHHFANLGLFPPRWRP